MFDKVILEENEFLTIKDQLNQMFFDYINKTDEELAPLMKTMDPDLFQEMFLNDYLKPFLETHYYPIIEKLASYDLSQISSNLWEDFPIYGIDPFVFNLEGTNANIDFQYFSIQYCDHYNLKGCHLTNLEEIDLIDLNGFDEDVIKSNFNIFLDDAYPIEFRQNYYDHSLTINDYLHLDDHLKERFPDSFHHFMYHKTYEVLGSLKKVSELYKLYPDEMDYILNNMNFYHKIKLQPFLEKFKDIPKEEFLDSYYSFLRDEIIHDYRTFSIEELPVQFIEENRDILLLDSGLPKDILEKYYSSTLSWKDVLDYPILLDICKNNHSLLYQGMENEDFVEILDTDIIDDLVKNHSGFLEYVFTHKNQLHFSNIKNRLNEKDLPFSVWLKKVSMQDASYLHYYLMYIHKESSIYPDGLTLKEILERRDLRSDEENRIIDTIISYIGYDNIMRFQEETSYFTKEKFHNPLYNLEFIGSMIQKYNGRNNPNIYFQKENYNSLLSSVKEVFTCKKPFGFVFDYRDISTSFQDVYPNIFLREEELDGLGDNDKKKVMNSFYSGTMEYEDVKKYPILVDVLKNKDLEIPFEQFLYGYSVIPNFLELCKIYGDYLKYCYLAISSKMIVSLEDACSLIDEKIYENIINGSILKYGEDLPLSFQKKYPYLFLPKDADSKIKERFYYRKFLVEDFLNDEELLKYFTEHHVDLVAGMNKDFSKLIGLKENASLKDNYTKLKIIEDFETWLLTEEEIGDLQDEYISMIREKYDEVDDEFLRNFKEVLMRIMHSNSSKLYRVRSKIMVPILRSSDPIKKLESIEDLYLRNHLPDVFKTYQVFRILHTNSLGQLVLNTNKNSSPVLLHHSLKSNELILSSDLVKVALESNNSSIRNYIHSFQEGYGLYQDALNDKALSMEQEEKLKRFSKMLMALYNESILGKNRRINSSGDFLEDIKNSIHLLSPNGSDDYDLVERVTKMFAHFAGFNSYKELLEHMDSVRNEADRKNRERVKRPFQLRKGDLIKGINSVDYLLPSLQNGIVATEFLGSDAKEKGDSTPLDTDFSYSLFDEDLESGINHSISRDYGPVWFIIEREDPNIEISRDFYGEHEIGDFHKDKIELFRTGEGWHFGIRTGIGSCHISYIVTDNYSPKMGVDVAMGGFYIPIVDKSGHLLFTEDDYDEIRRKMSGLSHYGINTYTFSNHLVIPEVLEIQKDLKEDRSHIQNIGRIIKDSFRRVLENVEIEGECYSFPIKECMDGDLSMGTIEVIDTGSTSRGTSMVGDYDFDYMFRIDSSIFKNSHKRDGIIKVLGNLLHATPNEKNEFREKGVLIDGVDESVDIDISFEAKRDNISYTTDMCLKDRLDTIKKIDPLKYDLVCANIIYAKKVLKDGDCYYKHGHSKWMGNGGLGGVGVENWILQNGGSFIDAAENFVAAATNEDKNGFLDWNTFKYKYQIWDFGENFHGNGIRHDNFVYDNMDELGYKAMLEVLLKELKKYKSRQEVIEILDEENVKIIENDKKII